VENKLV